MDLNDYPVYLNTTVNELVERGLIDRTAGRACHAAKPPLETAADIKNYLRSHGNFSAVPGCRRPGRIPSTLRKIAEVVRNENAPKPDKNPATVFETAAFSFLNEDQRLEALEFKKEYGYLPMFRILACYMTRPGASRNDHILAKCMSFEPLDPPVTPSFMRVAENVGLTRERVRQIAESYRFPDEICHAKLWKHYADHSTYYIDNKSQVYRDVLSREIPRMPFHPFAGVMRRVAMLDPLENHRYLARRGWTSEIEAWVKRLERLASMPRTIDSRLSLEGLAMGGALDSRLNLVVLNQIAPTFGILPAPPDSIILPKNA